MKKVWIFGDSISAEINNPNSYQQAWAHFLPDFLTDNIEYKNVAVGGTTLKWFYDSTDYMKGLTHQNNRANSRWAKILSGVEAGDIFIFFLGGANDHGQIDFDGYYPCENGDYIQDDYFKLVQNRDVYLYVGSGYGTHRYWTARSSVKGFADLLTTMIGEVKAKGATPMIARGLGKCFTRNNDNFDVFPASHEYMEILPTVAKNTGVFYLDVGGVFEQNFKEKGYQYMMDNFFMTENAINALNKECGKDLICKFNDTTHTNIKGAKLLCDIFVSEMKKTEFELNEYLK